MSELIEAMAEIPAPNPIRVETALSRYPVHRLAKHGDIAIDIRERNADGEMSVKWEVTHNSKYGHPGPLAYKLDTLVINRRIEEATRPIPRVIRLGSLRELIAELGSSNNATEKIRKALRQNAGAFITAKIDFKLKDGGSRTLEADFTRYSVVFTGEELPNGRKADAVYIILNDIYMQVINGVTARPLDYDYLKSLPPAPQRFYELLSYQMYAAIKNDRPRAKLLYSELCTYAPLTRQSDWEHARKQLSKIHAPHRKSRYIGKVDFQETLDRDGRPDWIILYQPGLKARSEYRAFAKRGGPAVLEMEPFDYEPAPLPLLNPPEASPLVSELAGHGVTPAMATQLIQAHGEEAIRTQLEHLEWLLEKKPEKISDPAAWLVSAIRNGHAKPKGFRSRADREAQSLKRQAEQDQLARKQVEQALAEAEKERREAEEKSFIEAYWEALSEPEQAELDTASKTSDDPELASLWQREKSTRNKEVRPTYQRMRRHTYIRHLLTASGQLPLTE